MGPQDAEAGVDVLASGIHDAKNRLFEAQTLLARAAEEHGVPLADASQAISGAAMRLSRTLVAYRLLRERQAMAIMPVPVSELLEDAVLTAGAQFGQAGIALRSECRFRGEWPLDRTLVTDVLVNALQNACRYARATVCLEAAVHEGRLRLCVNDDGPGYAALQPESAQDGRSGLGLFIAGRIAGLHAHRGRQGELSLRDGGPLGGALFELFLP